MSVNNKNIDQLFNATANAQNVPEFKEEYWNNMESILNQREKKRRGFILWTSAGIFLVAGLITSLFILPKNQTQTPLYSQQNPIHLQTDKIETNEVNKTEILQKYKEQTFDELLIHTKNDNSETVYSSNIGTSNNTIKTINNSVIQRVDSNKINLITEDEIVEEVDDNLPDNISLPIKSMDLSESPSEELRIFQCVSASPTRFGFYAKLSGGVMENYKTKRPFESEILDLSLNMEVRLRNNLLIRTGFGTQVTTNADLIVSKREKKSIFSINQSTPNEVNVTTDLSYQNLYDIYIPLEFGYQYRRFSFGVGIQGNYLVSTTMNQSEFVEKELVASQSLNGFKNGLNKFSSQGYLWLDYQIIRRLSLGIKVGTNVSGRVKENTIFTNESATLKPIYGQFSLRFNVF